MNKKVFVSCAVTGSGDTAKKHPDLPKTPKQIATAAIEAAKAGAAIAHIHVREDDGKPSRRLELYKEVVDLVRSSETDVILNLTTGMGGDLDIGQGKNPLEFGPLTDMANVMERIANAEQLLPEICTLDCGTMNFAEADYVMTNTPGMLKAMGAIMTKAGVKPEIEAFDTGHLWYAKQLVADGIIEKDVLVQLCMGVPWGAPDDLNTFMAMVNNVPENWTFSAFSLGRNQMPYVAATILAGGNVRVGLEDNLWLKKGVLAKNEDLVLRATEIIEAMGAKVIGPQEVRNKLKLNKRAPIN